jgi:hypothetical protein
LPLDFFDEADLAVKHTFAALLALNALCRTRFWAWDCISMYTEQKSTLVLLTLLGRMARLLAIAACKLVRTRVWAFRILDQQLLETIRLKN